jgi:hypothetical protein
MSTMAPFEVSSEIRNKPVTLGLQMQFSVLTDSNVTPGHLKKVQNSQNMQFNISEYECISSYFPVYYNTHQAITFSLFTVPVTFICQ